MTDAERYKRIYAAKCLAVQLMQQHKLYGWVFGFKRSWSWLGLCEYPNHDKPGCLYLSEIFTPYCGEDEIRDTILHEIAHALTGPGHMHDDVWRQKCIEIGASPKTCGTRPEGMPPGPWAATCPNCNNVYSLGRKPHRTLVCSDAACQSQPIILAFQKMENF